MNVNGESDLSTILTATPNVPTPALRPPTISAYIAGDEKANITWNAIKGATSYNLYYAAGTTVDKSGTKITGAVSPMIITGLTNGTQYAFAVSAVNATGESNLGKAKMVTPQATLP